MVRFHEWMLNSRAPVTLAVRPIICVPVGNWKLPSKCLNCGLITHVADAKACLLCGDPFPRVTPQPEVVGVATARSPRVCSNCGMTTHDVQAVNCLLCQGELRVQPEPVQSKVEELPARIDAMSGGNIASKAIESMGPLGILFLVFLAKAIIGIWFLIAFGLSHYLEYWFSASISKTVGGILSTVINGGIWLGYVPYYFSCVSHSFMALDDDSLSFRLPTRWSTTERSLKTSQIESITVYRNRMVLRETNRAKQIFPMIKAVFSSEDLAQFHRQALARGVHMSRCD